MKLLTDIEIQFSALSNPEKALAMHQYMKCRFPFFGIPAPARKIVFNALLPQIKKLDVAQKWDLIELLWAKPEREFQYFAVEIILRFKNNDWKLEDINRVEKLITTKSWWDSIDLIASYSCSDLAKNFPLEFEETVLKWTESDNIWLQRSTLLYQLKWKNETNKSVLSEQINKLKGINEFFIQKAIGWSLREYAKTNPQWVLNEVEKQQLTGLAKREALKHLSN